MNATSAPSAFAGSTPKVHPDGAQYISNPAVAPRSMSPQSQTTYSRIPPTTDPVRSDTGALQVPVYSKQEVARHSVPMGSAPLRQPNTHNTRPSEQNIVADHPHFQYGRNHPTPLQIPSSSPHPGNPQHLFTPATHHHPNTLPSSTVQSHPPLRTHPEVPVSPLDRTSAASLPPAARRQSDPSLRSPVHSERPKTAAQPAFDPLIISATDTALAPVRSALDTVWSLAVNNMRLAMNRMNNDFTYLAAQERQRNAQLVSKINSLETHLQASRQDVKVLMKERQDLQNILQAYKDENRKLHSERGHLEAEHRAMEGRRGDSELPQIDMNRLLGAVSEQVSKQMEQKMSAFMDQIEEQKSMMSQAEQRFTGTMQHVGQKRETSESESPLLVQSSLASPYVPAQSPSFQRGSPSTCPISPISSKATGTQQGGIDGVSTLITPAHRRSMTPGTILKNTTLVSTPAEMHTGDSPSALHATPSPTPNLIRRSSSFDHQPRKKPRLASERDDGSSTPNPLPSAVITPLELVKSFHDPTPQPDNMLSAMQIDEPDFDFTREADEKEDVSGPATVKPEPSEDAGVNMNTEGSMKATPSAASPRPSPKPFPHIRFPRAPPANQRNTKLGIGHIDLLYRTDNGMMTCRMCLSRSRDVLLSRDRSSRVAPVKKFEQEKATWDELISHCRSDHPKTCRDLEKLGPTQIAEMKQRLMSGEKSTVSRI